MKKSVFIEVVLPIAITALAFTALYFYIQSQPKESIHKRNITVSHSSVFVTR